jgi:hypothetical protein
LAGLAQKSWREVATVLEKRRRSNVARQMNSEEGSQQEGAPPPPTLTLSYVGWGGRLGSTLVIFLAYRWL